MAGVSDDASPGALAHSRHLVEPNLPLPAAAAAGSARAAGAAGGRGVFPAGGTSEDGAASGPLPPKGALLRLSTQCPALAQVTAGRTDFFKELAETVGLEVQRVLRYTLLGYASPLSQDLEQKATADVHDALHSILGHLGDYVDAAVQAMQGTVEFNPPAPGVDAAILSSQLDQSITHVQKLSNELAATEEKARKYQGMMKNMRIQYYTDLESQRDRCRMLIMKNLPELPQSDLEAVMHNLDHVKFFEPAQFYDEDTARAVRQKAAELQATFAMERDALLHSNKTIMNSEISARKELEQAQEELFRLRHRMGVADKVGQDSSQTVTNSGQSGVVRLPSKTGQGTLVDRQLVRAETYRDEMKDMLHRVTLAEQRERSMVSEVGSLNDLVNKQWNWLETASRSTEYDMFRRVMNDVSGKIGRMQEALVQPDVSEYNEDAYHREKARADSVENEVTILRAGDEVRRVRIAELEMKADMLEAKLEDKEVELSIVQEELEHVRNLGAGGAVALRALTNKKHRKGMKNTSAIQDKSQSTDLLTEGEKAMLKLVDGYSHQEFSVERLLEDKKALQDEVARLRGYMKKAKSSRLGSRANVDSEISPVRNSQATSPAALDTLPANEVDVPVIEVEDGVSASTGASARSSNLTGGKPSASCSPGGSRCGSKSPRSARSKWNQLAADVVPAIEVEGGARASSTTPRSSGGSKSPQPTISTWSQLAAKCGLCKADAGTQAEAHVEASKQSKSSKKKSTRAARTESPSASDTESLQSSKQSTDVLQSPSTSRPHTSPDPADSSYLPPPVLELNCRGTDSPSGSLQSPELSKEKPTTPAAAVGDVSNEDQRVMKEAEVILDAANVAAEQARSLVKHIEMVKTRAQDAKCEAEEMYEKVLTGDQQSAAQWREVQRKFTTAQADLAQLELDMDSLSSGCGVSLYNTAENRSRRRVTAAHKIMTDALLAYEGTRVDRSNKEATLLRWRIAGTLSKVNSSLRTEIELAYEARLRHELQEQREEILRSLPQESPQSGEDPEQQRPVEFCDANGKATESEIDVPPEDALQEPTVTLQHGDTAQLLVDCQGARELLEEPALLAANRTGGAGSQGDLHRSATVCGDSDKGARLASRLQAALFDSDRLRAELGMLKDEIVKQTSDAAILWQRQARWLIKCKTALGRTGRKVAIPSALLKSSFTQDTLRSILKEELLHKGYEAGEDCEKKLTAELQRRRATVRSRIVARTRAMLLEHQEGARSMAQALTEFHEVDGDAGTMGFTGFEQNLLKDPSSLPTESLVLMKPGHVGEEQKSELPELQQVCHRVQERELAMQSRLDGTLLPVEGRVGAAKQACDYFDQVDNLWNDSAIEEASTAAEDQESSSVSEDVSSMEEDVIPEPEEDARRISARSCAQYMMELVRQRKASLERRMVMQEVEVAAREVMEATKGRSQVVAQEVKLASQEVVQVSTGKNAKVVKAEAAEPPQEAREMTVSEVRAGALTKAVMPAAAGVAAGGTLTEGTEGSGAAAGAGATAGTAAGNAASTVAGSQASMAVGSVHGTPAGTADAAVAIAMCSPIADAADFAVPGTAAAGTGGGVLASSGEGSAASAAGRAGAACAGSGLPQLPPGDDLLHAAAAGEGSGSPGGATTGVSDGQAGLCPVPLGKEDSTVEASGAAAKNSSSPAAMASAVPPAEALVTSIPLPLKQHSSTGSGSLDSSVTKGPMQEEPAGWLEPPLLDVRQNGALVTLTPTVPHSLWEAGDPLGIDPRSAFMHLSQWASPVKKLTPPSLFEEFAPSPLLEDESASSTGISDRTAVAAPAAVPALRAVAKSPSPAPAASVFLLPVPALSAAATGPVLSLDGTAAPQSLHTHLGDLRARSGSPQPGWQPHPKPPDQQESSQKAVPSPLLGQESSLQGGPAAQSSLMPAMPGSKLGRQRSYSPQPGRKLSQSLQLGGIQQPGPFGGPQVSSQRDSQSPQPHQQPGQFAGPQAGSRRDSQNRQPHQQLSLQDVLSRGLPPSPCCQECGAQLPVGTGTPGQLMRSTILEVASPSAGRQSQLNVQDSAVSQATFPGTQPQSVLGSLPREGLHSTDGVFALHPCSEDMMLHQRPIDLARSRVKRLHSVRQLGLIARMGHAMMSLPMEHGAKRIKHHGGFFSEDVAAQEDPQQSQPSVEHHSGIAAADDVQGRPVPLKGHTQITTMGSLAEDREGSQGSATVGPDLTAPQGDTSTGPAASASAKGLGCDGPEGQPSLSASGGKAPRALARQAEEEDLPGMQYSMTSGLMATGRSYRRNRGRGNFKSNTGPVVTSLLGSPSRRGVLLETTGTQTESALISSEAQTEAEQCSGKTVGSQTETPIVVRQEHTRRLLPRAKHMLIGIQINAPVHTHRTRKLIEGENPGGPDQQPAGLGIQLVGPGSEVMPKQQIHTDQHFDTESLAKEVTSNGLRTPEGADFTEGVTDESGGKVTGRSNSLVLLNKHNLPSSRKRPRRCKNMKALLRKVCTTDTNGASLPELGRRIEPGAEEAEEGGEDEVAGEEEAEVEPEQSPRKGPGGSGTATPTQEAQGDEESSTSEAGSDIHEVGVHHLVRRESWPDGGGGSFIEVVDCEQQSELIWDTLPRLIIGWLKLNLMQHEQSELYCIPWQTSKLEHFDGLSQQKLNRMVRDFQDFLDEVLCRAHPSKHEVRRGLRQRYRRGHSSSSPPPHGERGNMAEIAGEPEGEPGTLSVSVQQRMPPAGGPYECPVLVVQPAASPPQQLSQSYLARLPGEVHRGRAETAPLQPCMSLESLRGMAAALTPEQLRIFSTKAETLPEKPSVSEMLGIQLPTDAFSSTEQDPYCLATAVEHGLAIHGDDRPAGRSPETARKARAVGDGEGPQQQPLQLEPLVEARSVVSSRRERLARLEAALRALQSAKDRILRAGLERLAAASNGLPITPPRLPRPLAGARVTPRRRPVLALDEQPPAAMKATSAGPPGSPGTTPYVGCVSWTYSNRNKHGGAASWLKAAGVDFSNNDQYRNGMLCKLKEPTGTKAPPEVRVGTVAVALETNDPVAAGSSGGDARGQPASCTGPRTLVHPSGWIPAGGGRLAGGELTLPNINSPWNMASG